MRRSEAEESAANGSAHGLNAIRRAQLAHDRCDVELHGLVADSQPIGDAFVRQPFGEQLENVDLAVSKGLFEDFAVRIPSPDSRIPNPEPRIPSSESRVPDPSPGSRVPNPGSRSPLPEPHATLPEHQEAP